MSKILVAVAMALWMSAALAHETNNDATANEPSSNRTEDAQDTLDQAQPTEDGANDQAQPTEDGAKQSPKGEAKPEENWFGCKPDEEEQQENCDEQTDEHSKENGPSS